LLDFINPYAQYLVDVVISHGKVIGSTLNH